MTDFVFLGPSLPIDSAQDILDAVFLPPVAMGDLYVLIQTRISPGDRIAIIDGLFERVPAVWHKEILDALAAGIPIYGASSMGALRAAETAAYGMVGIGDIFHAFLEGRIADDDEVAVAHATREHGFKPLSDAMVNIRFGLESLVAQGTVADNDAAILLNSAKAKHYADRNWGDVIREARALGVEAPALDALRTESKAPGAKADDAVALLRHLAAVPAPSSPSPPSFSFNQTSYWVALKESRVTQIVEERESIEDGITADEYDVARLFRAVGPDREQVIDKAMLDYLLRASQHEAEPSDSEMRLASRSVAKANGVASSQELRRWRRDQHLSDGQWLAIVNGAAMKSRARSQLIARLDAFIVDELKRTGRYKEWYDRAVEMAQRKESAGVVDIRPSEWGTNLQQLEAWYEARFGPMLPDPESHARSFGFPTLRAFVDELVIAFALESNDDDELKGPAATKSSQETQSIQ